MLPDYSSDSQSAAPRSLRLAGMAALAYILVIIYASLQPFIDWRGLSGDFGGFLFEPRPRWITVDDVLFNFAAYLPLGFLLALALCARWSTQAAVVLAAIACVALSFTLEATQQFLPDDLASGCRPVLRALSARTGSPIVAPSAGRHRRPSQSPRNPGRQPPAQHNAADAGVWSEVNVRSPPSAAISPVRYL